MISVYANLLRRRVVIGLVGGAILLTGCFESSTVKTAKEVCRRLEIKECERGRAELTLDHAIKVMLRTEIEKRDRDFDQIAFDINTVIAPFAKKSLSVNLLSTIELSAVIKNEQWRKRDSPRRLSIEDGIHGRERRYEQAGAFLRDVAIPLPIEGRVKTRNSPSSDPMFMKFSELCSHLPQGSCVATIIVRADLVGSGDDKSYELAGWIEIIDFSATPVMKDAIKAEIQRVARDEFRERFHKSPESVSPGDLTIIVDRQISAWRSGIIDAGQR
jgi:hypothetical protein